jgi:hypothetical protein
MRVHMNGRKSFGFKHKAALHRGLRRHVNRLIPGVNFTSCAGPEKQGIGTKPRATVTRTREAKSAAAIAFSGRFLWICPRSMQLPYRRYWRFVAPLHGVCFNLLRVLQSERSASDC